MDSARLQDAASGGGVALTRPNKQKSPAPRDQRGQPGGILKQANCIPIGDPVQRILARLEFSRKSGKGWIARCPAHDDKTPSLSISEAEDGIVLLKCHAGCRPNSIVEAVGLKLKDLFPDKTGDAKPASKSNSTPTKSSEFATANEAVEALERILGTRTATWTYQDGNGEPVGVIARWDKSNGKDIRPVSRNGRGWFIGAMPDPRPLYRLPDLADAKTIYIVEGEKCADALHVLGLTVTTSAGGSQAFEKTDWKPLAGKSIVILPDHDDPGRAYATNVAAALSSLNPAPSIKVVELPGLASTEDVFDFIVARRANGVDDAGVRAEIQALVNRANFAKVDKPGAVMICLADVEPEDVEWLWPERIACGKLTLIVGDPGLGKSFFTLDMAARVSTGTPWPDCQAVPNPAGSVILLSAEDDLADTIRPRLDAACGDASKVHAIQSVRRADRSEAMFSLECDIHALEAAVARCGDTRLIIIDPVTAYLGGTDSHNNSELRGLLAPLAAMAAKHRVAIVAVSHLNKAAGMQAVYRVMGSLGFVAAARAAWCVVRDRSDPFRRLMLPLKNNLGNDQTGLAYKLIDGKVSWEAGPVTVSAAEALAPARVEGGEKQKKAEDWLSEYLAGGPKPQKTVEAESALAGIAIGTLRRAKRAQGVVALKPAFDQGWLWSLPGKSAQREHAQPPQTVCAPSACAIENTDIEGSESEGAQAHESEHLRREDLHDDDPFEIKKRRIIDCEKARGGVT